MSSASLLSHLDHLISGRRFRWFIGLLAVGQGLIRLQVIGNLSSAPLTFGSNLFYGISLIVIGLLVLLTANARRRVYWLGRVAATLLAVLYGTIAAAVWQTSSASAYASGLMAFMLLIEAAVLHEC